MNDREAAIIAAYTGISFGGNHFHYFHQYVEEKFGHPVWTHEMANELFWAKLKRLCTEDFMYLAENIERD